MRLFDLFKRKNRTSKVPRETLENIDNELAINLAGITQSELDMIFKYGKGSNKLGKYECKPFTDLPYGVVRKDMLTLQKKNLHLEAIMLLLECQYGPNLNLKGITQNDIFSFLVWVRKQQDKIFNLENFYLKSDPDPHMLAAGVHRLDELGALVTIHALAMNDISKHPYIEELPYFKVYEVLKLEKVTREIQKTYAEITKPKSINTRK